MQTWTLARVSCLGVIAALLLWIPQSRAHACKCVPPTVEHSYNNSTDVFTADIRIGGTFGSTRYYIARVDRTFKGCLQSRDWVVLSTPIESATCGAVLESRSHLIHGDAAGRRFGLPVFRIHSCSYNVAETDLTEHDLAFLNGRTVCCGDRCACADGSQPVQCFVDPCQVAPACAEGECVANYCGGCNAEFYDESGRAVCTGESESECASDADCPSGEWCRQAPGDETGTSERYECVPFVGAGESCNGFTLPWMYERCAEGLVCVTPPGVVDAPGICRQACTGPADCKPTGCSGTICAVEDVITTCEFRPEYACYDNASITQCGCVEGRCSWSWTESLAQCLAAGGPEQ